jgi:fucose permease
MSLSQSFYCWGHAIVVVFSTFYFVLVGIEHWPWLALFWAALPIFNAALFSKVPIARLTKTGQGMTILSLLKEKAFWVFLLLMLCAGASEQSVSQWSSAYAEAGLGISKTIGDLMGPFLFALFMGAARFWYSRQSARLRLSPALTGSIILCIAGYLLTTLSPWPFLGLIGCGICGLSVGILWPGILSMTSKTFRLGGTAMFALLALAGNLGCATGPMLVGFVADSGAERLSLGILVAIVFPCFFLGGLSVLRHFIKKGSHANA